MKRLLVIIVLGSLLSACNSGGGGGGGTPAPAKPTNPNGGDNGGGTGRTPEPGDANIACLIYEPATQAYWTGFGDSTATATEVGTELCNQFSNVPGSDCKNVVTCEERIAARTWTCTVRNSKTGDVWTDKGRSKIETFSMAHGICAKGFNASNALCGKLEQASCVKSAP